MEGISINITSLPGNIASIAAKHSPNIQSDTIAIRIVLENNYRIDNNGNDKNTMLAVEWGAGRGRNNNANKMF